MDTTEGDAAALRDASGKESGKERGFRDVRGE
jgi:hypothetical protein